MRQRVAGEGLPAHHQEIPDDPATTATMPAAAKALGMNSYWNMSVMVVLVAVPWS